MGKILLYGNNPALLLTRRLVLERSGQQVFSTSDIEQGIGLMTMLEPHILVLCQSLTVGQRETVIITARELQPEMNTLVMMDAGMGYDLEPHDGEVLYALDGPEAVLTVVERMLGKNNSSWAHA